VHLINTENLRLSYQELKQNKSCGIDEMTVEAYGKNLDERFNLLAENMKAFHYQIHQAETGTHIEVWKIEEV
jgi:hypothetical protein